MTGTAALTTLDDVRAIDDPTERAERAAALLVELESSVDVARQIRDDAMTLVLAPPYGSGTLSLAAGARLIGVTRGFMRPYFNQQAVASRRLRRADAARAATG